MSRNFLFPTFLFSISCSDYGMTYTVKEYPADTGLEITAEGFGETEEDVEEDVELDLS